MPADPMHERLLAITLKLPGATEDWPWGSIHCKVDGKIFVGWGRGDDGEMSIGIRTTLDRQAILVGSDPRFSIAKYVGKYGGIDMTLGPTPDWSEVEHFIVESYRLIASKKRVAELDGAPAEQAVKKTTRTTKTTKAMKATKTKASPKPARPRAAAKVAKTARTNAAGKSGGSRKAR